MRGGHLLPAARALALLRVIFGGVLLIAGMAKMGLHWFLGFIPLPVVTPEWQVELPSRLGEWTVGHPTGVLAAVIRDLVVPHGALFAGLLGWFQLLAGLLLVLGLFARAAAFAAGLVSGALLLTAMASPGSGARVYLLWGALAVALLLGDAGQTIGIDGWRREQRRGRDF